MGRYLVQRFLLSLLGLFALSILCFCLLRFLPGSPLDEEFIVNGLVLENLRSHYGFNQPIGHQLLIYLKNIMSFNFGPSIYNPGESVADVLLRSCKATFLIGSAAFLLTLVMGSLLAWLAHLNLKFKTAIEILLISGFSIPTLLLAPLLILVFAYRLDWFPIVITDSMLSYVLPVLVLAIRPSFSIAQILFKNLNQLGLLPHTQFHKAQGLSRSTVIRLNFKMAFYPVFAYLVPLLASLITGSVIVETLFNNHGLGFHLIEAIQNRDYNLVCACVLLFGFVLVSGQFIFDFIQRYFDPRIDLIEEKVLL
jgi:ABC-type dipeptide/oligopeptide/nickel transport system permease component